MLIVKIIKLYKSRKLTPITRVSEVRNLGVKVGENCEIYDNVSFGSEPYLIELGDNVRVTRGVTFITHDGGMWVLRNAKMLENSDLFGRIKIGNNVHIGINSVIMPGVSIGNNVVIGVGSVVTRDVLDNCIVAGVPAKKIRSIEDYYEKYKDRVEFTKNMNSVQKREYLLEKYQMNRE